MDERGFGCLREGLEGAEEGTGRSSLISATAVHTGTVEARSVSLRSSPVNITWAAVELNSSRDIIL